MRRQVATYRDAQAVPWFFAPSASQRVWSWRTDFYLAVVAHTGRSWLWEITVPPAKVLAAGTASSFDDSEHRILEALGKAYPNNFPYACYTQEAKHWYVLANGQRYSLAQVDGAKVIVTLDNGQRLGGMLTTGNWWLQLSLGQRTIQVNPARVKNVQIWKS